MKNNTYSSKDFSTISAKLIAETPEKLIHRDVLKASIDGDIVKLPHLTGHQTNILRIIFLYQ
ncbi:hypothetical protein BHECKSOX_2441 [Bathymodiolus heckerae thiotrophic gill symbiont]|nr:hypothetical protein BHECKSOX_2441 [Bathymodiolus heckerae thiotrophic gill symbiont]